MRRARVARKTKETTIAVDVNLDGTGKVAVKTGIPFLDHMVTLLATHACWDLTLKAAGDLEVDLHHTNEDVGLVVGQALDQALGRRAGITRFGLAYVPMEEALIRVVLDVSGRPKLVLGPSSVVRGKGRWASSAAYDWGDAEHLLESLVRTAKLTLHIEVLSGEDFHHTCEAVFKGVGRALEQAVRLHPRFKGVPSSKGQL